MSSAPEAAPMLVCLSGSLKGCTLTPVGERIVLGTDPDCTVRFPPSEQRPVQPHHAEIIHDEEGWLLRALVEEPLILNETPVRKARLHQNDLFRLGPRGPLLRFHARSADGSATKSFRQILLDSAAFSREQVGASGSAPRVGTFARQVIREAVDHGTRRLKLGVLFGSLMLAAALGLGVWQTIRSAAQEDRLSAAEAERQRLDGLQRENSLRLQAAEEHNRKLLTELGFEREQREALNRTLTDLRSAQDEGAAQLRELFDRSTASDVEVQRLRGEVDAAASINKSFAGGVAMIAVGIAFFHEDTGRYVRRIESQKESEGGSGFTLGGGGDKVIEWITGSGFLVDDAGLLVSNRHVIDPWWNNDRFGRGLMRMGFKPVRVGFFAFFPGHKEPFPLVRVGSADKADIAFARLQDQASAKGLPVLKLRPTGYELNQGEQALLLGFPEGVQGLVNKLEDERTKELQALPLNDLSAVLTAIAERDGIRPSMTAGVISNITTESLVYSAVTTSGGSGGPLFSSDGIVIGVNTAVSREFTGHNFGTRIEAALEVMAKDALKEERLDERELSRAAAPEEPVTPDPAPEPEPKTREEPAPTSGEPPEK